MGDTFYQAVRWAGWPLWALAARPIILHQERVPGTGRVLLAPNHLSPYDVPCLIAALRRPIDFVSITELFRIRWVGWFFGHMNALPLERQRPDPVTVRRIIARLEQERAVVLFPEGGVRRPEQSVLKTGEFHGGVVQIARLAKAPIIPCALLGTGVFAGAKAWVPARRARYGIAFGEPVLVEEGDDHPHDQQRVLGQLRQAYADLYRELSDASGLDVWSHPWRKPTGPSH